MIVALSFRLIFFYVILLKNLSKIKPVVSDKCIWPREYTPIFKKIEIVHPGNQKQLHTSNYSTANTHNYALLLNSTTNQPPLRRKPSVTTPDILLLNSI